MTLTWDARDKLIALKNSLLPNLDGLDWSWIIKDNGSKDDTVAQTLDWGSRVKTLATGHNRHNFSQGMNICFNEASPNDKDYVLLLNNDVIFNDTNSIKHMIKIMDNDPTVGVVGARLLYTNTNKIQHCGVVFNQNKCPLHLRANVEVESRDNLNREFQVVTGAVLLTTAENYKNACTNSNGNMGLDESFFWAFDDVDFCLSIKYNLNKKIVYCGNTNIFHEESSSLKKNPMNKLFMNQNLNRLFSKWRNRCSTDQVIYESNAKYNLYEGK